MVQRHRQIVEVRDEWAVGVDDDLALIAEDAPEDALKRVALVERLDDLAEGELRLQADDNVECREVCQRFVGPSG